jgi:hypothetical protein
LFLIDSNAMFFISLSLYREELALAVTAAVEQRTISGLRKIGDNTVLETMILLLPPDGVDEDDVTAWASFAQTSDTIYESDTSSIQLETGNKRGNETGKIRIFHDFVGALSRHRTLHPLVGLIPDPKSLGQSL